jgi:hypothetical protein
MFFFLSFFLHTQRRLSYHLPTGSRIQCRYRRVDVPPSLLWIMCCTSSVSFLSSRLPDSAEPIASPLALLSLRLPPSASSSSTLATSLHRQAILLTVLLLSFDSRVPSGVRLSFQSRCSGWLGLHTACVLLLSPCKIYPSRERRLPKAVLQSVHWIAPCLSGFLLGVGLIMVFLSLFNYIIDTYLMKAGTALASTTVIRSLFGFGFPLFARQVRLAVPLLSLPLSLRPADTFLSTTLLRVDVQHPQPSNRRYRPRLDLYPLHARPFPLPQVRSQDQRDVEERRRPLASFSSPTPMSQFFCSLPTA